MPGSANTAHPPTAYDGSWLVDANTGKLLQYDGQGKLVRSGAGGSLAISLDGTQTAFTLGNHVHVGIASEMSNGESDTRCPEEHPVAFTPDGKYLAREITTNGSRSSRSRSWTRGRARR